MPKTSIAVFNALICVFTLGILDIPNPTCAAALRTAADDEAFSEHIKASAESDFIHQVFEKEGQRLTGLSDAPLSPEVAKLLDSTVKHNKSYAEFSANEPGGISISEGRIVKV